ncbi:cysteine dioxygenase [Bordetella bronchialis]|uniref:Cysteine dioxygenase n=1 Tax=Bordetella bronchialis TaxID=463025 RepID=A0A193FJK8_9BORD|nr:cysteine dioxygenase [Bordetella bronchialis]ANN67289.1 cysteine dioxygenase [Bordetella bronchialis]ANN72378.1 cysteine dioxygenase [Bordetella bronchialis]
MNTIVDAPGMDRLRDFIAGATRRANETGAAGMPGPALLAAFRDLVSQDDWLPADCTVPHPQHYQQYLLHCDPLERFCIVSFVWGPGQATPVHDHTVWGYVGMLRGEEISQRYEKAPSGMGYVPAGAPVRLTPGTVEALSPAEGDIHQVRNAHADRVSISVHMYGANIGAVRRSVFDPASGAVKPFVSGYSASRIPNIWDRSASVRAAIEARR